jgi:anti-anti-sigma regulatory factor
MDTNTDVWTFPQEIEFWLVPDYLKKIEGSTFKNRIVFDLSETENVHSSFIGFLIFVKQSSEKHRGKLILKVSPSLKKLFAMLNVLEYFATSFVGQKIRRIA